MENDSLEFQIVCGEPLDHRGPLNLNEAEPEDPIGVFLAKVADEFSLRKNGGRPVGVDPCWSQEIGTTPRTKLSQEFLQRSDERMRAVKQTLSKFFRNRPREVPVELAEANLAEAISLAEQVRESVRKEYEA